jgi:CubicO group peptidase (beta-lactamase class C family)
MNDHELQQLLDDTAAKLGIVGAQLAVYDGKQQREFAAGYRHFELGLPTTTDTLFQIGSTTKLFNAALILSLVDSSNLELDTPVHQYLPDLRLADSEAQRHITLRRLLSMTAGLDNGTYHDYGRGDDAVVRYVEALAGIPQIFSPGVAFGYSNASSIVAGHTAARVIGRSWEQLLIERIVAPLGLKRFALFAEELLQHPVALGYRRFIPNTPPQRTPIGLKRSMGPSGSMTCCSAGDLLRLARMFLDNGRSGEGIQVLSPAAIESMQRPQVKLPTRLFADEWCAGPYRKQWDGEILYGHSGTTRSGSSTLLWCPRKNVAIATAVNVAEQGYPLADAVLDVVFPQLFGIKKPAAPSPNSISAVDVDLRPYTGRFEAFGMAANFIVEEDQLMLSSVMGESVTNSCQLIPLGEGRLLPCDLSV